MVFCKVYHINCQFTYVQSWILLSPIYLFKNPEITCNGNAECEKVCSQKSSYTDKSCSNFYCNLSVDQQKQYLHADSLIMAFDNPLTCNREELSNILQSLVYFGSLVGFFIFSFVADNYGRKLGLGLSWFIATLGALFIGASFNFIMVGIGIFFTGLGINPAITIHYSFINEHTWKFRDVQNVGVQVFFGFGGIFFVAVAYFFPQWRVLALFWFSIPIGLLNLPLFYVEESPKFAYQKDKLKAVAILNKIAAKNNKEPIVASQVEGNFQVVNADKMYSIKDLLKFIQIFFKFIRYNSLRLKFLCGLLLFFAIQAIYYGISFASSAIGLNLYINSAIIASCETFAYAVTDNLVVKLPRKKWILIGFIITCSLSFTYQFLKPPDNCGTICTMTVIQIIIAGVMRFLICFVWALTYIYLSELFPTVVRSLALGLISAGGTVGYLLKPYQYLFLGSMVCPFLVTFSNHIGINPLITLGVIGVFGAISTLPLKETFEQKLENDIEEETV